MPIIPNSERTHEELAEMGRRGGLASGITRRRQKVIKEIGNRMKEVFFLDLYGLAQSMGFSGIKNIAAMEWLVVEIMSGLSPEQKKTLISPESLAAIGFTEERSREIIADYQDAGGKL